MASGVENVYGLGGEGVNVVDSPLHLKNGEVTQAQNAAFPTDKGQGGLGMRGGLARVNGTAMGGSVAGVINVPLPAPGQTTRTFLAALMTADADTWASSTNGTAWTEGATLALAQTILKAPATNYVNQRAVSFNGRVIYSGNDYTQDPAVGHTAPPIRVYDGATDSELARVPFNPNSGATTNCRFIADYVVHDGRVFLAVYDDIAGSPGGRVLELDPESGQLSQIGPSFTVGMPYCLCSHNGLLWAGTYTISGGAVGRIYSIRVDVDTTWTLRVTTGVGAGYIRSMASYKGLLYFGTNGDAGTDALLRVLANDYTTVTTSDTGTKVTDPDAYDCLAVYDGELYAVYHCITEGICHVRKFDGTSWTTDLDVDAVQTSRYPGQALVNAYDGSLLISFVADNVANANGYIYRKVGGVWTAVVTASNVRGFLGRVDVN